MRVGWVMEFKVPSPNSEVADKLGVAFLPAILLFASVGGAGGDFLGFLSPSYGASA